MNISHERLGGREENNIAIQGNLWYNFPEQAVKYLKQKEKENESNGKYSI
jgi:hypothetical protein